MTHKTIRLKYKDKEEDIDIKIVPLIRQMWKAGIRVNGSCQNNKGKIWLQFDDSNAVCEFLNIIGTPQTRDIDFHDRLCKWYQEIGNTDPDLWWYEVIAVDNSENDDDKPADDERVFDAFADFSMVVTVWFPRSDLPEVLKRLKAFNKPSRK